MVLPDGGASLIAMLPRIAAFLMVLAAPLSVAAQQPETKAADRSIAPLGDDLYDVRVGTQHTMFVVTADSIVLIDPLGLDTALWLRGEFEQRFPGKPVRYVVVTHHHLERASGDGAFRGATIVGHADFARALAETPGSNTPTYRYVASPRQTFTDHLSLTAGGKTIELFHVGPFHSRELTVVSFPWARKAFAVDPPPIHDAPFVFGTLNTNDVVKWLTAVARISFDTMLFGDGTALTRDQIVPLAEYLSRMRANVVSGYGQGRSLDRLQTTLRLDPYRTLPHYAARREQIEAMFDQMGYARLDVVFSGLAHYLPENVPEYCNGYATCSAGGAVAGGSVAATVALGRKFGAQVELFSSDQFWSTRTRAEYEEEVVFKPSRASLLFRYSPLKGGLSYALLTGVSRSFGDAEGMNRVEGRLIPIGGRHVISKSTSRLSYTAGIDLSQRLGPLRLVLPLRISYTTGELPDYWPAAYDAHAGIGIAIPLLRRLQ